MNQFVVMYELYFAVQNEETNKGEELEEPENKSGVGYEELLKPDDQNSGSNRVKEDEDTLYLHVVSGKIIFWIEMVVIMTLIYYDFDMPTIKFIIMSVCKLFVVNSISM